MRKPYKTTFEQKRDDFTLTGEAEIEPRDPGSWDEPPIPAACEILSLQVNGVDGGLDLVSPDVIDWLQDRILDKEEA